MVEKASEMLAKMAAKFADPVLGEAYRNGARSHASAVPSSGVGDVDNDPLRPRIKEQPVKKEDLLDRLAGKQKNQMYTLWKLCAGKKKSDALEADVKRVIKQLTDVRAAHDESVIKKLNTNEAVGLKQVA